MSLSACGVVRTFCFCPHPARALHRQNTRVQEAVARKELQRRYRTDRVRDVHVDLSVHSRTAELVYVPAYLAEYTYGTQQRGSIDILAQKHQALIPAGAAGAAGAVFSESHVSPARAQAAAVSVVTAGKAAVVAAAAGGATAGELLAAIPSVDTAFAAFLAGCAAGVMARGYSGYVLDRRAAQVQARADAFVDGYMPGGMSAMHVEGARDLWLRADMEWLRWEGLDADAWLPDKRRRWAERLLREQKTRTCARRSHMIAQTAKTGVLHHLCHAICTVTYCARCDCTVVMIQP